MSSGGLSFKVVEADEVVEAASVGGVGADEVG